MARGLGIEIDGDIFRVLALDGGKTIVWKRPLLQLEAHRPELVQELQQPVQQGAPQDVDVDFNGL